MFFILAKRWSVACTSFIHFCLTKMPLGITATYFFTRYSLQSRAPPADSCALLNMSNLQTEAQCWTCATYKLGCALLNVDNEQTTARCWTRQMCILGCADSGALLNVDNEQTTTLCWTWQMCRLGCEDSGALLIVDKMQTTTLCWTRPDVQTVAQCKTWTSICRRKCCAARDQTWTNVQTVAYYVDKSAVWNMADVQWSSVELGPCADWAVQKAKQYWTLTLCTQRSSAALGPWADGTVQTTKQCWTWTLCRLGFADSDAVLNWSEECADNDAIPNVKYVRLAVQTMAQCWTWRKLVQTGCVDNNAMLNVNNVQTGLWRERRSA